jgi:hypothetical protein
MDALKRFWQHFPAWFVFIMGFSILNYVVVRADPKVFGALDRDLFALTVVIPMAWFVLYFTLTIRREGRPRPLVAHAATWALAILVPLGTWFLATRGYVQRERLGSAQMVRYYEIVQFFWLGVLVLHAWTTRGLQRALTFFGVCFLYGLLLENAGIVLGFFSEHSYSVYLRLGEFRLPAPLATQFGWCIMFYVATHLVEGFGRSFPALDRRPWALALLTSLLATSLDLQIDPMASLSGTWWLWDPRLPAGWLGVPWLNFFAWFAAFLPFSYAYFHYRASGLTEGRQNLRLLVYVPWMLPACMLLGGALVLLHEGGFGGPSSEILAGFARKVLPY